MLPPCEETGHRDVASSPPLFTRPLRELADRLTAQPRHRNRRFVLGIVGEPGAGKSTVSAYVAGALGTRAAVVPFDGFHFANALLLGTELRDRKGAIDTFDLAGYRLLIQRLWKDDEVVVYAPAYYRELEEPIAASIAIPRSADIIITEGNYLLCDHPDLDGIRPMLDEVWYVEADPQARRRRLVDRHIRFGKTPAEAVAWATGSDEANARAIRATRHRADLIVHIHEEISSNL